MTRFSFSSTKTHIRQLREMTGAPLMKCKEAIDKFDGDFPLAKQFLFEKNLATAEKKSARETNCGCIAFHCEHSSFIGFAELFCETDFVLKNEHFLDFGEKVKTIFPELKDSVRMDHPQTSEYLKQSVPELWEENQQLIAKIQENIKVNSVLVDRLAPDANQVIGTYMHTSLRPGLGKSLTYVVLGVAKDSPLTEKELGLAKRVSEELAIHVFCMKPEYIREEDMPSEERAEVERAIEESLDEKIRQKPESILQKIVSGKREKMINHRLLVTQELGDSDDGTTVQRFLDQMSQKLGFPISVERFHTVKI